MAPAGEFEWATAAQDITMRTYAAGARAAYRLSVVHDALLNNLPTAPFVLPAVILLHDLHRESQVSTMRVLDFQMPPERSSPTAPLGEANRKVRSDFTTALRRCTQKNAKCLANTHSRAHRNP